MTQLDRDGGSQTMLEVKGIHKSFGQNAVLKGIDLSVKTGEVIALIGGNGAGKSTLMKIIMGIYQPDQGEVFISGQKVTSHKPSVLLEMGVYLVPQEPMLFPNMTVEANVLIGFKEGRVALHKRLVELLEWLGWHIDLTRKAESLSIAEQQMVEILRGLMRKAKVLILDEPTSALTFNEVKSLFKTIDELKKNNISMIYITHRLTEVFDIATHVAIMRDGVITLNQTIENTTKETLVKGLLPPNTLERKHSQKANVPQYENLKPVMQVKNLSGYGFSNISFDIYPGEILGLAGVVGAGRTELAISIFGKDTTLGGQVFLDGKDITGLSMGKIIQKGLNYVPEDRYLHGLFKISDVATNTTSACFEGFSHFFMNFRKESDMANKYIQDFNIKVTGQDQLMGSLSGGNQQKVVIGRALSTAPKVVILDEPTRGIDAVARGDVYHIINLLKEQGVAVLLISSDMEEIMELSDRALTMFQGNLNHCFDKQDITQDNLTAASFGVYEEAMTGA